jgi:pimeloyl-ACP methyl ester carboxylesterase/lysophospholipase L1-like esterase
MIAMVAMVLLMGQSQQVQAQENPVWFGYEIQDSVLNGSSYKIVFPETANENRDWIWRARFWGHEPQTDIALLEQGFHLAYIDVGGLFGNEEAIKIWDAFYKKMTEEYQLNSKVVLEGMSRGGLIIYNWANQNADRIACIYADAPVCDFKSWPKGYGVGVGSEQAWEECLAQYRITEEQAMLFKGNPVDHLENIAATKVPILHVVGDADKVVPVSENTGLLKDRLIELGWDMKVLHKPGVGHHPHSLKDPKPIVDFILINTGNRKSPIPGEPEWSKNNTTLRSVFRNCKIKFEQESSGHVAFIGGSITEMNGYRPKISSYLEESFPHTAFTFTDAGIASTGSTTGAFRMERDVLIHGHLDLLFIEFAVNDDQDSKDSYKEAMLGMEGIIRKARIYNPDVDIVLTYFVNPHILENYQKGIVTTSIAAHDEVATYYNISTCNLAKEVADQISIGTLNWETFGGTHPNNFGNLICSGMIIDMLEEVWSQKEKFATPEPLNQNNFENGKLVDPAECNYDSNWFLSVPDWDELDGNKRDRFLKSPLLWTTKKGAKLSFEFTGRAVGVYILSGPYAGIVKVSIDGGPFADHDLYHKKFSKHLHYPQTIMFANDLDDSNHLLELQMLKEKSGSGNAMRIMDFVVN